MVIRRIVVVMGWVYRQKKEGVIDCMYLDNHPKVQPEVNLYRLNISQNP